MTGKIRICASKNERVSIRVPLGGVALSVPRYPPRVSASAGNQSRASTEPMREIYRGENMPILDSSRWEMWFQGSPCSDDPLLTWSLERHAVLVNIT